MFISNQSCLLKFDTKHEIEGVGRARLLLWVGLGNKLNT